MKTSEAKKWDGFEDLQEEFGPDIRRLRLIVDDTEWRSFDVYVIGLTTAGYPVFRFHRPMQKATHRIFRQYGIRWKQWYLGPGSPPQAKALERGWAEIGRWEPGKVGQATQQEERWGKMDAMDRRWGQTRIG